MRVSTVRWTLSSVCLVAAALVCVAPVGADSVAVRELSVPADATIEVEARSGRVRVEGSDGGSLRVSIEGGAVEVRETVSGARVASQGSGTLTLRVPRTARIRVQTARAEVEVAGVLGDVSVDTVNGDVAVDTDGERVEVRAVAGEVEIGGSMSVVVVATTTGGVTVEGPVRELRVETVNGSVVGRGLALRAGHVTTASGDVRLRAASVEDGLLEVTTFNGRVDVDLGDAASVAVEAETVNGDVDVELVAPDGRVVRPSVRDGTASAVTGDGAFRVRASTFNGSCRVRAGRR